ncbi:hypothetical protein AZE42_11968 [Rhizopogon vesiculosus]|uniref:Uncharacterized protein n=1 Tax=Rhizopogon vesiculosus TaxID=180088 RepID=A0A1J8Q6P5_9AGAM|nr:hypothetical protein AZE42_11968 [Rhizopogon vesiculosus]
MSVNVSRPTAYPAGVQNVQQQ